MSSRKIITSIMCLAVAVSMAACAKTDNSENNRKSSKSDSSSSNTKREVKIYTDEDGAFYYDDDSNVMRLSAYPENGEEEAYEAPEPIYGTYDQDGVKFDIPDGYYADTSFGLPVVYSEDENLTNENVGITTQTMYNGGTFEEASLEYLENEYKEYKETESIREYEIKEIKDITDVNGTKAKAYSIAVTIGEDDENTAEYYSELIFLDYKPSYVMIINGNNNEESIARVDKLRDSILKSLTIDPVDSNSSVIEEEVSDKETSTEAEAE